MKVSFAHLCDYATISREGKLSVMGIFTNISAPTFPAQHPMQYLVFEIELSPAELGNEITSKIELRGPDGGKVTELSAKFHVGGKAPPGSRPRIPQIVPIQQAVFPSVGTYSWSIWLNGSHKRDVDVDILHVQPPIGPPA